MKIILEDPGAGSLKMTAHLGRYAVTRLEQVDGQLLVWFTANGASEGQPGRFPENVQTSVQEAVRSYAKQVAEPARRRKKKGGPSAYWAKMSPAERQTEMARRVAKRAAGQASLFGRKRKKR